MEKLSISNELYELLKHKGKIGEVNAIVLYYIIQYCKPDGTVIIKYDLLGKVLLLFNNNLDDQMRNNVQLSDKRINEILNEPVKALKNLAIKKHDKQIKWLKEIYRIDGYLFAKVSDDIQPYVEELKKYGFLPYILSCRALLLWEEIINANKEIVTLDIDTIRYIITARDEKYTDIYSEFEHLERKILKPLKICSGNINYKKKCENKKVIAIDFYNFAVFNKNYFI